jgi:ankyrin repeat protein
MTASWQRLIPAGLAVFCVSVLLRAEIGRAPLLEAAKSGDKDAVKSLLQKKADANAAEADGTTALHWASYHDDLVSADLLIRAGAKVNSVTDLGVTPLWLASENGSSVMVRRLLEAGANPNLSLLSGETPLMVAARSGYPDAVEQLLAKGANANAHGVRGQTALMWAVSQQHPEVVKVLIAHHADLNLRSDVWTDVMAVPPHGYLPYNKAIPHGGETAFMFAARVGDLASAKLLVTAGANVNDADAWGVSATTLAAHSGFTDFVLFVLDKGADPNAAPNGFTALHEAIMRRDEKMVAALLDHGADASAPVKTRELGGRTGLRAEGTDGDDHDFAGRDGNRHREAVGGCSPRRTRSLDAGSRQDGCGARRRCQYSRERRPHGAGWRYGSEVRECDQLPHREGR